MMLKSPEIAGYCQGKPFEFFRLGSFRFVVFFGLTQLASAHRAEHRPGVLPAGDLGVDRRCAVELCSDSPGLQLSSQEVSARDDYCRSPRILHRQRYGAVP